jgi:AbrB family looped-hinge helix DNA binding protein
MRKSCHELQISVVIGRIYLCIRIDSILCLHAVCGMIDASIKIGGFSMDMVKLSVSGQVTIPAGIRKRLGLKDGDNVVFIEESGRYYVENAALAAFNHMQEVFIGEAERVGLRNEDDVAAMVKEIRRDRWEKRRADNA